jgi:hypothetical protein
MTLKNFTQNVRGNAIRIVGVVLASVLFSVVFVASANAATFTVNTTDDGNDANPGDGVCEITVGDDDCGIRALIEETNALAGADVGNFSIPGAGVHTFVPATDYPQIVDQLTIDGSTQPGASCGTLVPASLPGSSTPHTLLIEVDGNATSYNFQIADGASNSVLRGLVLHSGQGSLLSLASFTNTDLLIECNYFGTNVAGTAPGSASPGSGVTGDLFVSTFQNNLVSGNGGGIDLTIDSSTFQNNLVGTDATGILALPNTNHGMSVFFSDNPSVTHNVISGNTGEGIFANGNNFSILGNYIGLNVAGTPLGNTEEGLYIAEGSNDYTIGSSAASMGNVISANGESGLVIYSRSGVACPQNVRSTTQGNQIGTTAAGAVQAGYGNGGSGIEVHEDQGPDCVTSVYKHVIGGDGSGEQNVIAGNTEDGVRIFQSEFPTFTTDVFSISLLPNSIHSNLNLGINLATDSDNDGEADVDLGPNALNSFMLTYPAEHANNYLNRPSINSAAISGTNITVNYDFQAPSVQANSPQLEVSDLVGFRLDFYVNSGTQDGAYAGYSQGKTHLGSFIIDGSTTGSTHTFVSPVSLSSNDKITATATVLWQNIPNPCPTPGRYGDGPPYDTTSCE